MKETKIDIGKNRKREAVGGQRRTRCAHFGSKETTRIIKIAPASPPYIYICIYVYIYIPEKKMIVISTCAFLLRKHLPQELVEALADESERAYDEPVGTTKPTIASL